MNPKHFLFVTYRWGADLLGGAELHHRRLALELKDLGHRVSVWTTTAHEFRSFAHWGALWTGFKDQGTELDEGIEIRRFPARQASDKMMALGAKLLQSNWESRPISMLEAEAPEEAPPLVLGTDWHEPEPVEGRGARRWSWRVSTLWLKPKIRAAARVVVVRGFTPWRQRITLGSNTSSIAWEGEGQFELLFESSDAMPDFLTLICYGPKRPVREFRQLGALVDYAAVVLSEDGTEREVPTDFFLDLRRMVPDRALVERAKARPGWVNWTFDRLRGPNSPVLHAALQDPCRLEPFDVIVSCNFPWRVYAPGRRTPGQVRALMPLLHAGDSYYYWTHYLKMIETSDLVLANTSWSAEWFRRDFGANAHFVGPPIWPEPAPSHPAAERSADAPFQVLCVCRKSPEKRYMDIAQAVSRLRESGLSIEFVGVGPDVDGRALPEGSRWLGRLDGPALVRAYAEADAFCLMSDTESFGMVVVEAWHAGLPVIVNRRCGPTASLVEEGVDGLLATPGVPLEDALRRLAADRVWCRKLGAAGQAKAQRDYVRGSAAGRFLAALGAVK